MYMPQKPGCEIKPVGRPREENILTSANDLTKNIKRVIFTEEEIKAKIAEAGNSARNTPESRCFW